MGGGGTEKRRWWIQFLWWSGVDGARENGGEWEEKERRVDSGDLLEVVDLVLVVEWRRWWGREMS